MKFNAIFATCLLLLAMESTDSGAAEIGVTDTEIFIGAHTNESGKFVINAAGPRAAAAYFDMINQSGGINGRKIKYTRIDVAGDYGKTVQAVKKLVEEDHVFGLFYSMASTHKAALDYIVENNVLDFNELDALQIYASPLKKNVFPASASIESEAAAFGDLVGLKYKGKKACFLLLDDTAGVEFLKGATDAIEKANAKLPPTAKIKIGATERTARTLSQANTQVLALKRDGCDVVMSNAFAGLAPNAIAYGHSQGFKPTWMVMNLNASLGFLELIPEDIKSGIISSAVIAPSEDFGVPGWKSFVSLMEKNNIPLSRSQIGYAAAEQFVETLRRTGKDVTREKFIKAAESMKGWTCSLCLSPLTLSGSNHWPYSKPTLVVSSGSKWIPYKK